mmetsp:Transcript_26749/g.70233  ORF Transcript_26749/g.70233 Transcript_26749/m.70233 type:complete len:220 (-) Transcript_26749:380-1039(-)
MKGSANGEPRPRAFRLRRKRRAEQYGLGDISNNREDAQYLSEVEREEVVDGGLDGAILRGEFTPPSHARTEIRTPKSQPPKTIRPPKPGSDPKRDPTLKTTLHIHAAVSWLQGRQQSASLRAQTSVSIQAGHPSPLHMQPTPSPLAEHGSRPTWSPPQTLRTTRASALRKTAWPQSERVLPGTPLSCSTISPSPAAMVSPYSPKAASPPSMAWKVASGA